ncbi:MAG: 4-phosphoerythronate dehydrogenase [Myxococcales bacterium FL481]|nr:MAG: 4-phosphoerythronate dehydrogenase [Myxococcales bacterium FL481]
MIVVVDEKVTAAREFFAPFGEVRSLAAADIDRAAIADADGLVVRSVTRVDDELVDATRLRFVGSATAGTDHIDASALQRRGIAFAHAPGANAPAVCEYVVSQIFDQLGQLPRPAAGHRVGIVGYGQIGRRLASWLAGLGLRVDICDPPLAATDPSSDAGWLPLTTLLERCNILTLHTPLVPGPTREGGTRHLIDGAALQRWSARAGLIINTSRGEVVDQAAVLATTDNRRYVFDVWEGEPEQIRWELLAADGPNIVRATPHVAGYSLEAKLRATARVAQALAQFVGGPSGWNRAPIDWPAPSTVTIELDPLASPHEQVRACLRALCPLDADDLALRGLLELPVERRAEAFRRLRPSQPTRRSFAGTRLCTTAPIDTAAPLARALAWLGVELRPRGTCRPCREVHRP